MRITRRGYYRVIRPDRSFLSRHVSRDECYEAITEDDITGTYIIECPNREVDNVGIMLSTGNLVAEGVTGTIADGQTITISGSGFGSTGPTMMYYDDYSDVSEGNLASTTPILGRATVTANSNGMPIVNHVAGMPYGKGLEFGAETDATTSQNASDAKGMRIVDSASTDEYFHFWVWKWPTANQNNAATFLDGTSTWQQKPVWHFESSDGFASADDNDLFESLAWVSGSLAWNQSGRLGSNTSFPPNGISGFAFPTNQDTLRDETIFRSYWIKPSPLGTQPTDSDGHILVTGEINGQLVNVDFAGIGEFNGPSVLQISFDRIHFPGFIRGFSRPNGAQAYAGQLYASVGAGCTSRVEITDNATYVSSNKRTICTINSWSDTSISAKIRRGVFGSLGGLYFHIIDSNNDVISSR